MIFVSELNFVQHCKEKITAYSGPKRNFIYLDEDAFVMLYNSLVRSHLQQGWAQGSFVEADRGSEVEAEARQGSNVLNRGEARQRQRQRARGRGEAD